MTKFVIFGGGFDWFEACYFDIKQNDNVLVINRQIPIVGNALKRIIGKLCYCLKRRRHTYIFPFWRKMFFSFFDAHKFLEDANRIVFIIYDQNRLDVDFAFARHLKKKYGNKLLLVYSLTNTVEWCHANYSYNKFDDVRKEYDLVTSYNHDDCDKYGLVYYPLLYSKGYVEKLKSIVNNQIIYDCVFVGQGKDRLDVLHKAYLHFKNIGAKVKFYIVGVKKDDQIEGDNDLIYNIKLSHEDNVKLVLRSRSVLDIQQGGSSGYALRIIETLFCSKTIITNNPLILKNEFGPKGVYYINQSTITDIDISFFRDKTSFNEDLLQKFQPSSFLDFLSNYLQ